MNTFLVVLIASVVSGILYRLGGAGEDVWKKHQYLPKWFFNSKWRDAGCPLVSLAVLWYLKGFILANWWAYLVMFGLGWAACSTYWDFIFGYDNFWIHGLFCGLAVLPLAWCGMPWWAIAARSLICAVLMGAWSLAWKWDVAEEWGRGFIFTASLLILCYI